MYDRVLLEHSGHQENAGGKDELISQWERANCRRWCPCLATSILQEVVTLQRVLPLVSIIMPFQ